MNSLNPQQKSAVRYIDSPLLVLAGAGSGKTSVITHKIAWLISACNIPARHIAAVTFTNKAAREMKQRIAQLLPINNLRGLTVSTFHHLGLQILRKEIHYLNRKSNFSIIDQQDCTALLKEIFLDHGDTAAQLIDLCQQQISHWKNENISPAQAQSLASSPQEQRMSEVYKRYEQALLSYNAIDFDDLILLPVRLFEQQTDALERWRYRIRFLLVDEYQDTNASQYRLVQLILGERKGLCVVGDDDQSIYAWRGAKPENLAQLQIDFPDLNIIKLEQNYRSTNRILRSANTLISNNPHVHEKKLWSEKGLGEKIKIISTANDEAEADFIVNDILNQKLQRNSRYKDFAVLVRGNHQTKLLELKLQQKQVPYYLSSGTAFFSRGEIKDTMAYLRLLVNPDDDTAFLRIINVPRRKIGSSTLQALGEYASERQCSMFSAIDELGLEQHLSANALERLRRFSHWLKQLQYQIATDKPIAAIKELINDIDYESWLHQNSSSPSIAESRMQNIYFLLDCIYKDLKDPDDDNDLESIINKLLLRDLLEQQAEEQADEKVQIMTLHAAKGLEFPYVFIMGFEENILPHRNSIDLGDIDEERRLAYVGITRAQQELTLTLAKQRKQFGELTTCEPSRFIAELPSEDIHKIGFGGIEGEKANQQQGNQTLNSLKGLFNDV